MTEIDIDQLLKILPKLIRENDTVKGAIISALSGVLATKDDIKELIRDMDKRFEAMDKRFEAMDKRFEAMDKRFDSIDSRFETLEILIKSSDQKKGVALENAILRLLRHTLKLENLDPEKIRKQRIVDPNGDIVHKGYKSDIDVLMEDGKTYLIEIKATGREEGVLQLLQNAKLYAWLTKKTITQLILVALRIDEDIRDYAESNNIKVIYGKLLPALPETETQ